MTLRSMKLLKYYQSKASNLQCKNYWYYQSKREYRNRIRSVSIQWLSNLTQLILIINLEI